MLDPLYAFVFAGLFSPGPNVILLTSSGARFGFLRTLPHVLGVAFGVGITSGLTAFGLGALLLAQPWLTLLLKVAAAGWILWMAWKLLHAARAQVLSEADRPFRFHEAVLFQWVNPKVWAIAVAASAGFSAGLSPTGEALRMASAFSGINLFVCLFWSFAGSLLTFLLTTPRAWTLFNGTMAAALALSAAMVFL
ncbi:LysE family translocator [Aliiruegeria haliotis]|uniref:LysE family translocator n=1 Tax=Aliiruegeria haliotis TaxID=1280846 RepID=UPI000D081AE7|nr:LysE family translocator [Aliiruegeria haliotis]